MRMVILLHKKGFSSFFFNHIVSSNDHSNVAPKKKPAVKCRVMQHKRANEKGTKTKPYNFFSPYARN